MKRFLTAIILVIIWFSMTGCASAQQTGGATNKQGTAPVTNAPPVETAPLTWTLATQRGIPGYAEAIAYGNGKFVVGGRIHGVEGAGEMVYSTDGITWTTATDAAALKQQNGNITFCGGRFFAAGWPGTMATSTDGENWTTVVSNLRSSILGTAYGNGKWVIATDSGRIFYSTDGVTWTETRNRPSGWQYRTITYGNGKFIVGSTGGRVAQSTDGVTWTAVTDRIFTRPENVPLDIIYTGGKFFAYGARSGVGVGELAYSIDGITWTAIDQGSIWDGRAIRTIVYGGGKYVAVTYGDSIMAYSTDGLTWSALDTSVFDGNIHNVAYGGGRFVAVGSYGQVDWERKESTVGRIAYSNLQE